MDRKSKTYFLNYFLLTVIVSVDNSKIYILSDVFITNVAKDGIDAYCGGHLIVLLIYGSLLE